MPALATLAVVFVGIGGGDAARVDRQVQTLLTREAEVELAEVTNAQRKKLATHASGSSQLVRDLHVDGLVAGQLEARKHGLKLTLVVYGGDGHLVDLIELPLGSAALDRDALDTLRSSVIGDVTALGRAAPEPRKAKPDKPAKKARRAPPKVEPEPEPEIEVQPEVDADADADDVPGLDDSGDGGDGGGDAFDPDDLEDELGVDGVEAMGELGPEPDPLRLRVVAGFGMVARSFSPGPATIPAYSSAPVASLQVGGEVRPSRRVTLAVTADRTVSMSTQLDATAAPTTISRWQGVGGYQLTGGTVEISLVGGVGRRSTVIESKEPMRSPDAHYGYLVAGTQIAVAVGKRATLHGDAAIEPVVTGAEPTAMAFGPARRWGLELGAGLEVAARDHLYVRADVGYQRFQWSWTAAGDRGSGGAADVFPSASLAVGASY
ncbi:MAG: hypothetical protein H6709_09665 [Kofleriaceae bacterium]|nr:hypothetical protein [Myxococcales bacterium]MCB9565550.1 hypothetical protein [Kofleriaceae bacterium]MCB9572339.1 hypothetical protein [Kofleriaceae bacterium]